MLTATRDTDATARIRSLRRNLRAPSRSRAEFSMPRPLPFFALQVLAVVLLGACSDGRRFSPEAWRQEDQFERTAFTSDLIARRLLIGKQWHEVNAMLGQGRALGPEASTWNVGMDKETGEAIVLEVDFRDGFATRA